MIDLRQVEFAAGCFQKEGDTCSLRSTLSEAVKRVFDVLLSLAGLILLSPFLLIIGLLVVRESPGPVFYRGPRVGKGGQLFQILKFRTMYERPETHSGPRLTAKDDPRITRLGRWLRDTKINELPQLWNVLVGDMSLVGPRPEDPVFIDSYPSSIRREILSMRPGITSPASVLYHSEEDLLTSDNLTGKYIKDILPDKLRLDQLYVRNRSFTSDLDTILWTLSILTPRLCPVRIPEGYLFAGPLSRIVHRYASWLVCDFCCSFAAVSASTLIWRIQGPLNWGEKYVVLFAFCLAFIFSAFNYLAGLHRIIWSRANAEDAVGLFFTAGAGTLIALSLNEAQSSFQWFAFPPLPFGMILCTGLLAQSGFIFVRYRFRLLTWITQGRMTASGKRRGMGERVLIVGDGEASQVANWLLRRDIFRHAFSIVGIVATEDPTNQGMQLHGSRVLGGIGDLPLLIKEHDVRLIVYTVPNVLKGLEEAIFELMDRAGIKAVFLDDLLAYGNENRPTESIQYLEWSQHRVDSLPQHDLLTGLPNGTLLRERLQHSLACARRYHTTPALLTIDLEDSSRLVDGNRIHASQELLGQVARRLAGCTRESDTLSYTGNCEFALLFDDLGDDLAAETVLRRARTLMAQPFQIKGYQWPVPSQVHLYVPEDSRIHTQEVTRCDLLTYSGNSGHLHDLQMAYGQPRSLKLAGSSLRNSQ